MQGKQAQVLQLLRSPILIGGDSAYVHRPRLSFAGEDSGAARDPSGVRPGPRVSLCKLQSCLMRLPARFYDACREGRLALLTRRPPGADMVSSSGGSDETHRLVALSVLGGV